MTNSPYNTARRVYIFIQEINFKKIKRKEITFKDKKRKYAVFYYSNVTQI